jgi:hypothetical protein
MRLSVACALLTLVLAARASVAQEAKKSAPADDSAQIAEKLLVRMDISERTKVQLREALDLLEKRTGLSFLIDYKAFAARTSPEDARPELFDQAAITLPAMKGVRVETVLRAVTDQLDADFLIAPDHVRITTAAVKDLIIGQARPLPDLYPGDVLENQVERTEVVRATSYVTASFRDMPAAEALKEVAARAGRNVVISAAAGEKAKAAVTVSLSNVAFETAAASLAEAAGLRAFRTGNVVVIVTPERVKQMEGDTGPRVALGGYGAAGGVMTLGELETIGRLFANKPVETESRRKELEEKVRMLTEELQKLKK